MRQLALTALALAVCAPAQAQTDALCASLEKLIAAAPGATPFVSLLASDKPVQSFARIDAPAGLEDAVRCEVYLAGTAEKVIGGGTHNKAGCVTFDGSDDTSSSAAAIKGRGLADALAARVKTCLEPKGWTAEPKAHVPGGRQTIVRWRFAKAGALPDVSVELGSMVYGRSARDMSTDTTVSVFVRTPNPKDPSYKPPS